MIAETSVVGIDVCRDWLDGFCLPGLQRFRLPNSPAGHQELISMIRQLPASIQVGFEATGGQEWALWTALVEAGIVSKQLPPSQIKAFAMSRGTRAKTDRIDAELIARFMLFRPDAGRMLPGHNLRILRTLTTRRASLSAAFQCPRIRREISRESGLFKRVEAAANGLRTSGQLNQLRKLSSALAPYMTAGPPPISTAISSASISAASSTPCFRAASRW
ncbi:transposase [Rhodobacter sp. 24-YEA-8]|nr:transposase [Rhodobacter sp. 24-YEA-8]